MAFQSPLLRFRPLVFAAIIFILVSRAHGQCYFPGGNWAQFQSPCDPHAFTSQCCPQGYACFSNHLCVLTDNSNDNSGSAVGSAIRGTCTNPSWDKDACGTFCLDDPVSDNSGRLVSCGDNKWCCGPAARGGTCNCDSGSGTFSVQSGEAQTIIGSFGSSQTILISFSSRQTSPSNTEQSQKTIPQSMTTAPSPAASANPSSHSTTTVSPLSTPSSSSQESSHNSALKVSLGTVFPALGLAAIIAGYFLWRRNRAQNGDPTRDGDPTRNGDPTPEPSNQLPNQPPPGQYRYELQQINPLRGDEPFVNAPDQDEYRFPPAVTPSPTPSRGPVPSYSRLVADRSQPRGNGSTYLPRMLRTDRPDQRTANVPEEENLQRRYMPDPL